MPLDKPTLVFDAFVALEKKAEILAFWPEVTLDASQRHVIQRLTENLGFLGRAESWAEARVLSDGEAIVASGKINCTPSNGQSARREEETVRVLCADPTTAFSNEYTPKIEVKAGKAKKQQIKAAPLYDPDWHLCMETLELHEKRWSDPPGSEWITYLRPKNCFAVEPKTRLRVQKRPLLTVARFAVDSNVLPLVEDTLKIAELTRRTLMGIYRRIEERKVHRNDPSEALPLPKSEVLSGKDAEGNRLQGHRHAYYLPTDEDADGRVDHLTVIAAMGFGPSEQKALDEIRRLKRDNGDSLGLLLLALGQLDAIGAERLLGPSKSWVSATPFIVTRHSKKNGQRKDPPELLGPQNQRAFARQVFVEELARFLELRPDVPEPVSIEFLNDENRMGAHRLRPIQFKRFRQKGGDDGGRRPAGAFRIVFSEPIRGPICLGHSSHFGMGLLIPEKASGV
jgi:CRISPR-associated protein Csb2